MTGILGIGAFGSGRRNWRVAGFLYYGLLALQHRGQEAAYIATADGNLHEAGGVGSVDDVLVGDLEIPGYAGIGITSISGGISIDGDVALVGDGEPFLTGGWKSLASKLSSSLGSSSPIDAAVKILDEVPGAYSFIALTPDGTLMVARDPSGLRPLEVGSLGFDMGAVASESSALEVMGMRHVARVEPGEVLVMDGYGVEKGRASSAWKRSRSCSFEYVYMARHDSIMDRLPVYRIRVRIGEVLAEEAPAEAQAVVGVPETAMPIAAGYSKASGIPLEIGFVSTGRRMRTAIEERGIDRLIGVQLKLNTVEAAVEDRDVVLVDDSVVRGTTLRNVVWALKRNGARRVHVRIGSPPLRAPCPYGSSIPEPDELIGSNLSEDQIAEVVGADSLRFLSLEGLIRSIGLPPDSLCLRCWGVRE